jgi:spermidine synthase
MLTDSLPYWPISPSISASPWFMLQLDLVRCLWAVLPAATVWGASFPLALASLARFGQDPGRLVGGVYAANTVGAIAGSLGTSFVLVTWIGTRHVEQLLIVLSLTSGALLLAWDGSKRPLIERLSAWRSALSLPVLAPAAVLLILGVHEVPAELVAYGRYAATRLGDADFLYVGEGRTASVAVSRLKDTDVLNYHNAGKVQASSEPQDMRLERMLGHLTTLVARQARSVVVIGCGAGVTAGAVAIDPEVERVTVAEIEPLSIRVVSTHFAEHNFDVIHNPKVRVAIDDGRHYVLTQEEKFDALTSDPLDPWVKGAAMLYTKEFFEIVKERLNPGGVITVFVQLYESNIEAVKSELATFFDVFPNGLIFGNTYNGAGYDLVLLGQAEPTRIDVALIDERLRRPEYAAVLRSLQEIGFDSARDLFSTYGGRASDLKDWLKDAAINRDRNLRLQYLAGLGLDRWLSAPSYSEILSYRRQPDGLFVGSSEVQDAIWKSIETRQ